MSEAVLTALDITVDRESGGKACRVLGGVSLEVSRGQVVDVGGPSGAGKTTLLLALARLLDMESGSLRFGSTDSAEVDPREWRRRVTYVPQVPALLLKTVEESLLLPWSLKVRRGETPPGREALRAALDAIGLGQLSLGSDATKISVGQAARVNFARAILAAPDILLLDEPDANLDEEAATLVSAAVRSFADEGRAVIRVRHRPATGDADVRLHLTEDGRLREVACA